MIKKKSPRIKNAIERNINTKKGDTPSNTITKTEKTLIKKEVEERRSGSMVANTRESGEKRKTFQRAKMSNEMKDLIYGNSDDFKFKNIKFKMLKIKNVPGMSISNIKILLKEKAGVEPSMTGGFLYIGKMNMWTCLINEKAIIEKTCSDPENSNNGVPIK